MMTMKNNAVRAMILAAGEGTRLKKLTLETPKVLLPVGGVPLIEHTLGWLRSYEISRVVINLYHLGEIIMKLLGDGARLNVEITYSNEDTLLGTAGGVKRVENFFGSTFLVVYGDVLADFNLSQMLRLHRRKRAMATIAVLDILNQRDAGIVEMDKEGKILGFVEKPTGGSRAGNFRNGGIYIFEKTIISHIPGEGFSDFGYDIFPRLVELDLPIYGYVLKRGDYLIDIGTIERYFQANEDVKTGKVKIKCQG